MPSNLHDDDPSIGGTDPDGGSLDGGGSADGGGGS